MSERWRCAAVLLGLLAGGPALAAEPTWPERLYNPQKADGDLVLPMPCGGAKAIRRVELPADGPLGDRRVQLGGPDEKVAYAESPRPAYVGGGFTEAANAVAAFGANSGSVIMTIIAGTSNARQTSATGLIWKNNYTFLGTCGNLAAVSGAINCRFAGFSFTHIIAASWFVADNHHRPHSLGRFATIIIHI